MKKPVVLYSTLLVPIWLMILWPGTWLVVLPVSFAVNTVLLLLAGKIMKITPLSGFYAKHVVQAWMVSFLSYIVGGLLLFNLTHMETPLLDYLTWLESIGTIGLISPYTAPVSVVFILICLVISILLNFFLNRYGTFKKLESTKQRKNLLSLAFALITAPYLMAAPAGWFF